MIFEDEKTGEQFYMTVHDTLAGYRWAQHHGLRIIMTADVGDLLNEAGDD